MQNAANASSFHDEFFCYCVVLLLHVYVALTVVSCIFVHGNFIFLLYFLSKICIISFYYVI